MKFKPIKDQDEYFKIMDKIVYETVTDAARGSITNHKMGLNEDGTMSKAANLVLKFAIDMYNKRDITEMAKDLVAHNRTGRGDETSFVSSVIIVYVPNGVEFFKEYYKLGGFKVTPALEKNVKRAEEYAKKHMEDIRKLKAARKKGK